MAEPYMCPKCKNDDKSMIEILLVFRSIEGTVTVKYLCEVCSKEWTENK